MVLVAATSTNLEVCPPCLTTYPRRIAACCRAARYAYGTNVHALVLRWCLFATLSEVRRVACCQLRYVLLAAS